MEEIRSFIRKLPKEPQVEQTASPGVSRDTLFGAGAAADRKPDTSSESPGAAAAADDRSKPKTP